MPWSLSVYDGRVKSTLCNTGATSSWYFTVGMALNCKACKRKTIAAARLPPALNPVKALTVN